MLRHVAFLLLALSGVVLGLSSTITTYAALTVTKAAVTKTVSLNDKTPSMVIKIPDATFSLPALTITGAVQPDFCEGSSGNACLEIESVAPDITSFDAAQFSAIVSQVGQVYKTYKPNDPYPNPLAIQEKILLYFDPKSNNEADFADRVAGQLWPFRPADQIKAALDALAPVPALQSQASQYVEQVRSYFAQLEVAERSIVAKELSLTGAAPSWISYAASVAAAETGSVSGPSTEASASGSVSSSTPASSTTSANLAAPTMKDSLLMGACVAAVGILGMANL